MKVKEGFILRQVGINYVLVPTGQTADFSNIVTLNETGAFIWKCLEKAMSLDEIAEELHREYDVDLARAKTDVKKYCHVLEENHFIE